MDPGDDAKQLEEARLADARAMWENLAARARGLQCPEHGVAPARVVVTGETVDQLNLQLYGCCDKLGQVIGEMIKADPRVSGPS